MILTYTAEDESNLNQNIQFLINCVDNMLSLFGITFALFFGIGFIFYVRSKFYTSKTLYRF